MMDRIQRVASIEYRCEPYDWVFARESADQIDAHWAQAAASNSGLYNGRVLLASSFSIDLVNGQNRLFARGFETDYKAFLAWRNFGFPGAPVFNLFSMCALHSADGAYLLGKMGQKTASPGSLYFPAGVPEPRDTTDGMLDLHRNMLRELQEETGFVPADVTLEREWTLVFDAARIACLRRASSPLNAAALVTRFETFRAEQDDPELDALVPVYSLLDLDEARMPGFMLSYLRDTFGTSGPGALG